MDLRNIIESRLFRPQGFVEASNRRRPRGLTFPLVLLSADGLARGAVAAGDREDYLTRVSTVLDQAGVDGVIGPPDVLDELLMLSSLEGKIIIGSMNYGGIVGSKFELDDVFTGFDAESLAAVRYNGGLIRIRLDLDDRRGAGVLERSAHAVDSLANHRLLTLLEPSLASVVDGKAVDDFSADGLLRAIAISTALGRTSRNMWLSLPVVSGLDRVVRSTTVPVLVRADSAGQQIDAAVDLLARAIQVPGVHGVILGSSVLLNDDAAGATNAIVDGVRSAAESTAADG